MTKRSVRHCYIAIAARLMRAYERDFLAASRERVSFNAANVTFQAHSCLGARQCLLRPKEGEEETRRALLFRASVAWQSRMHCPTAVHTAPGRESAISESVRPLLGVADSLV
jgi:hypothetical protein